MPLARDGGFGPATQPRSLISYAGAVPGDRPADQPEDMGQLLAAFGPILMFMLIPLWIPVIAITAGAISDRVRSDA